MNRAADKAWRSGPVPAGSMIRLRPRSNALFLSNGRTVLATDRDGFIAGGAGHGLFVHETRLLSQYRYSLEGTPLYPVALSNVSQHSWCGYYIAQAPSGSGKGDSAPTAGNPLNATAQQCIELMLSRYAGGGFHEDVALTNYSWCGYYIAQAPSGSGKGDSAPTAGNPLNATAQQCIDLMLSR